MALRAQGVARYACGAAGAWLSEAETLHATLLEGASAAPAGQLLPAPAGGSGPPTWRLADGSALGASNAAPAASAASPTGSTSDLPWQLTASTATAGAGFAGIAAVQRVDTVGGGAPSGACSPSDAADVPFGARYVFYVQRGGGGGRCGRRGA